MRSIILFAADIPVSTWIGIFGICFVLLMAYHMVKYVIAEKNRVSFDASLTYVILAIEPPKDNEQMLSAVENIFLSLSATFKFVSEWERVAEGKHVIPFSFEIVSIDGYIQFLVRTEQGLVEYVSALFYAQYPDCRIYEIEDYAERVPDICGEPDGTHDCWGTELALRKEDFIPIKTYLSWDTTSGLEERDIMQIQKETHDIKRPNIFDTPFANLIEVLGRLKRGELVGLQIVATPANDAWQEKAEMRLKELTGEASGRKPGVIERVFVFVYDTLKGLFDALVSSYTGETIGLSSEKKPEKKEPKDIREAKLRKVVEAKLAKPGYECVFRLLYVSRTPVFNKARGVMPIMGALKQFAGFNGFRPGELTTDVLGWYRKEPRLLKLKKAFITQYKRRAQISMNKIKTYILNTEELTSLFHLPISGIRSPMVARVEAKTSDAPAGLPIEFEEEEAPVAEVPVPKAERRATVDNTPANLPHDVE